MITAAALCEAAWIEAGEPPGKASDARMPRDDTDLRYWLELMVWHYGYTLTEMSAATGLRRDRIEAALRRLDIHDWNRPPDASRNSLKLLPYPGGRHPRSGFLEGAVRPQRETKAGVFTPWDRTSYVVLDVPEAIWSNLGLLYLAHTHVPTVWTRRGLQLEPLEWRRGADGVLELERQLPNGVAFGTRLQRARGAIKMQLWLRNGSAEKLTGLRVQACVLLAAAKGFERHTNDNKHFAAPYAACRSQDGARWIISAWDHCERTWANADCPCMHSDPRFPDCELGQTQRLAGGLWFYEGADIKRELARLEASGWRS